MVMSVPLQCSLDRLQNGAVETILSRCRCQRAFLLSLSPTKLSIEQARENSASPPPCAVDRGCRMGRWQDERQGMGGPARGHEHRLTLESAELLPIAKAIA